MKLHLYSVHDKLLGVYLAPFASRADIEAIRQMKATLSDPQMKGSSLLQNPQDFDLCHVGSFDDENGHVVGYYDNPPLVVTNIGKLLRDMEDVAFKAAAPVPTVSP